MMDVGLGSIMNHISVFPVTGETCETKPGFGNILMYRKWIILQHFRDEHKHLNPTHHLRVIQNKQQHAQHDFLLIQLVLMWNYVL